jgi:pimeloyl-ACP methyl ester carboxylesterase
MAARRRYDLSVWLALLSLAFVGPAAAQNTAANDSIPLVTKDGVQLKISYFPGTARKGEQAKQTTPVVMLHDYRDTRAVFAPLIKKLQAPVAKGVEPTSFAIVTVDLRAHGESVKQSLPNGAQIDLDATRLSKDNLIAMASMDMEAVRSFLLDKNDAGELNLSKLCVVGSGMGANVAANWALVDWSAPPLAVGTQGQDVKALALISPRWNYSGLSMQGPMKFRPLKEKVAWLLIFGEKDREVLADFNRINNQLKSLHPASESKRGGPPTGLEVLKISTKLQGDSLLAQPNSTVENKIAEFLIQNVAKTRPPWFNRRNRLP